MARRWMGLLIGTAAALGTRAAAETISYWDSPRHGSNLVDTGVDRAQLESARGRGVNFLRISPSFWKASSGEFLLGNALWFLQIPQPDVEALFQTLTQAHDLGLRVVLTTHTLPGLLRGLGGSSSQSMWSRRQLADQAIDFWRQLATSLKGHPALAGYDLVDEPRPESVFGPSDPKSEATLTSTDLNYFYDKVVQSIRSVDADTPIIVESGFGGSPAGFDLLKAQSDSKVLYSFHLLSEKKAWTRAELERGIEPVTRWQKRNHVPSSRILVGAFGVPSSAAGADRAITEAVALFKEKGWHWAHYALKDVVWPERKYASATEVLFKGLRINP